ncbi:MAG: YkgJ family cysteine cluster protein [Erythrobacter sp.]
MSSSTPNISELCVSCGLCCSGAVFSHAKLSEADKDVLAQSGVSAGDGTYTEDRLHLPCRLLQGTACSIYDRGRPQVCGEYLCKLARELDAGEISLAEAKQVTTKARELLDDASSGLPAGTNISTGAKALLDDELPNSPERAKAVKTRLAYVALQTLVDKRIRTKDQKWIEVSAMR